MKTNTFLPTLRGHLKNTSKLPKCLWCPESVEENGLSEEDWSKQHDETSITIRRVMLSMIGYCFFCFLALSKPDIHILGESEGVRLPFANVSITPISFFIVGPVVLVGIAIYLHVFVEHLFRLNHKKVYRTLPFLFNIDKFTANILSVFIIYWLTPITLVAFSWKASPMPGGQILTIAAFVISAILFFLQIRRFSKDRRLLRYKLLWSLFLCCLFMAVFSFLHGYSIKRSLNLHEADLSNRNLTGFRFDSANLKKSKFVESNLEEAIFIGANLSEAILKGAILEGAVFFEANLEDAILNDVIANSGDFKKANLNNAKFRDAFLVHAKFQEANLTASELQKAKLQSANLSNANLLLAQLQEASLSGSNLEGANLEDANFQEANLQGANLQKANLQGANLLGAKNLNFIQLSEAKTLYRSKLESSLKDSLQKSHPTLFEELH